MDRPITTTHRRRRLMRRIAIGVSCAFLLLIGARLITGVVQPSVRRARIRTAIVDRGPVEATITASGKVMPEHEQVVTSPIDTRVIRILKQPGAEVKAGEPIVLLDVSESKLRLEKLVDQIALKRKEREQARLDLEESVADLQSKHAIKTLELQSFEYRAGRDRTLVDRGIVSEDEARRSETDAARASIELELIDRNLANARRGVAVQLERLALEISILQKDHDEAAHRLELATGSAKRDGVLTWVVPSEGTAVRRGDDIARIADLSSFRVDATVSDVRAARLAVGQPVIVRTGDTRLDGRLANILPTVERGVITFQVSLAEHDHPVLRHNLRVDAYVVTERRDDAIRIQRGAYVRVDGREAVFVVHDGVATRTPVRFGITSFEIYEVLVGLAPGDEVIVSDMSDHMHVKEVKLR